ncbi:hypothetical protein [Streptomyces ardesiacus]|uniref:hypothetical protein n=1 Tax=Streptomyces ardesiacus TaxID=285564 RepID=UPI0019407BAE
MARPRLPRWHAIHKAFAELRRDELITTGYRRTTVLDLNRLRAIAQLPAAVP